MPAPRRAAEGDERLAPHNCARQPLQGFPPANTTARNTA